MMDLSLVPLDDLVEEIVERHDSVIVGMTKLKTGKESSFDFVWRGGLMPCLGMVTVAKRDLLQAAKQFKEQ